MTTENELLDGFEVAKNVTREFFVIPEDGTMMYLKFESPFEVDASIEIRTRKSKDNPDGTAQKEPMEVADVINLKTGDVGRIIGNAVIKSELRKTYPENGYVNRYFSFSQGASKTGRGGNKYRTFKIVELKMKGQAQTTGTKTK